MIKLKTIFITAFAVIISSQAIARDQIKIVGSSTVYPYSTVVAERFGKQGKFKTPVVESTGTGGGFKSFCGGVGVQHPEITGLKVFEIKITNPSQFNMFLKMREKGLMKNNIYIAKSNTFLELCYKANRDFIIYHKRSCLKISTMEKSTREIIKNRAHDIINECCICYESNVELS